MVRAFVLSVVMIFSGCAGRQNTQQSQSKSDDTLMIAIIGGLLGAAFIGFAIACGDKADC